MLRRHALVLRSHALVLRRHCAGPAPLVQGLGGRQFSCMLGLVRTACWGW